MEMLQDFPQAFGILNNDPSWQQHAQQYRQVAIPMDDL
jgi:hypothetical protein